MSKRFPLKKLKDVFAGGFRILMVCSILFLFAPTTSAGTSILYSFTATLADGHNPGANNNLIQYDSDTMYAWVHSGGSNNRGTAERIDTNGSNHAVLYSFGAGGGAPETPEGAPLLVNEGGTDYLYGVSATGGSSNLGTIFRMQLDGTVQVLHSFTGGADGSTPHGPLALSGTTLYGHTQGGGANSVGTIFKIETDGTGYADVYDFANSAVSGSSPRGGVMIDGGYIYGMTYAGGANGHGELYKYEIATTTFTHLYSFAAGTNGGYHPYSTVIIDGTTLYGFTWEGGQYYRGNVFKIQTDGSGYTGLHDFQGSVSTNGDIPYASPILYNGYLYGTTYYGGTGGSGTFFRLDTDGNNFEILQSFTGSNGSSPESALLRIGSKMYGMTASGGSSNAGIIFSYSTDSTAPTISSVSSDKANGSYTAGEVIDIDVTFSEAVTSTGSVTVTLETGAVDQTCTFSISSSTTGTCNYTVQAGDETSDLNATISGTIRDDAGNLLVNFTPTTSLATNKAIVIDAAPPDVSSYSPTDDSTGVATSSNLVLTFDENVVVGTGNVTIKKSSDDTTFETVDITDAGRVTFSTNTVTINPTATFAELTGYYVQVASTAIEDSLGNTYAGISDSTTWNFTTADETLPSVSVYSPTDGATAVATSSDLVLTFDENVVIGTGNILIKRSADDTIFETIDITSGIVTGGGSATITINPTGTFAEQIGYYVQIAATALDDASGNSYVGISDSTTWNFTTADETPPTVSSYSPTDGATTVATSSNLVLTFNESVVIGTGNILIKRSADDTTFETIAITSEQVTGGGSATITINPTGTFAEQTGYYVQIVATALDDASGNSYVGISDSTTWNFTTADETPPTVSSYSPTDNATGVSTTTNLVLTFDENIVVGTGNIVIKKTSDDSTFATIAVTDSEQVTVSDNQLTIDLTTVFTKGTEYYIQIAATALDDTSDNSYTGISDSTTWSFMTISGGSAAPASAPAPVFYPVENLTNTATTTAPSALLTFGDNTFRVTWSSSSTINLVNLFISWDGSDYQSVASNMVNTGYYGWTLNSAACLGQSAKVKIVGTDLASDLASVETNSVEVGCVVLENEDQETVESAVEEEAATSQESSAAEAPSPVTGELQPVSTVKPGQFIKSPSFPTVFYVDENFVRHPFLNAMTFFTYADSFEDIIEVTDSTLPTLSLGSVVLPAAGKVLVKIQSDPKVYAVDSGNVLRWVPSEESATALYGSKWADYVIDLEPTVFGRFSVGQNMNASEQVEIGSMRTRMALTGLVGN